MQPKRPSRAAFGAAVHRAIHQELEQGRIFSDPLALRILGAGAEAALRDAREDPSRRSLRLFVALRSRIAEDALTASLLSGVQQVVVLGAGLDTFVYRAALGENVRLFEVDHPATQAWKRQRLAEAAIPIPRTLTYVAVDFERETLAEGLNAAGFKSSLPTFFTWLGVVPYLTEEAVFSTLGFIADLPGGAYVVFDYGNPPVPGLQGEGYSTVHANLAERVASLGETFRSLFETDELHAKLTTLGFHDIEDLGPEWIRKRLVADSSGPLPERGGHILLAAAGPCERIPPAPECRERR